MTEAHPEIIIVKRHSAHEDEHHGGAWKIAFADFMTAMMAFSGAVDHQRDGKKHQDADCTILQSGEGGGAGESAEGHSWRARKGRHLCAGRKQWRPQCGNAFLRARRRSRGKGNRKPCQSVEAKRASAPAHPIAFAAA